MDDAPPDELVTGDLATEDVAELIARAEQCEDDWRWDEALAAWNLAHAAAEGDDRLLGECESGRGRALFALEDSGSADAAERAARIHFEKAGEHALAALCDATLAWREASPDDVEKAILAALAACEAIDAMTDDPRAPVAGARARQVVARLLFSADRPDEGEREYRAARDLFADVGDDRRLARCDAALALDLLGAGRLEEAEARAEAAVAGLTMLDREVDAAQLQLVVGRIQAQGNRLDEARANFSAAGAIFAEHSLDALLAEATHLEALMASVAGDDPTAIELLGAAIEAARRGGTPDGEAASRLELGLALGRVGRFAEAEDVFTAVAAALAAAGDAAGSARATYGVATTRRDSGQLEAAAEGFSAAIAALESAGFPSAAAQARLDGAGVLESLGRFDDALAWLEQAASGFATDGEPVGVALARRSWGAMAGHTGRGEALGAVAEARAIFVEHGAGWEVAECDDVMGRLLAAAGRLDEAFASTRAAVEGFGAAGDVPAVVSAVILLGRIQAQAGELDEAGKCLREAIALATEAEAGPLAARAHEALADVLEALDQQAEAGAHRQAAARLLA